MSNLQSILVASYAGILIVHFAFEGGSRRLWIHLRVPLLLAVSLFAMVFLGIVKSILGLKVVVACQVVWFPWLP